MYKLKVQGDEFSKDEKDLLLLSWWQVQSADLKL